LCLFFYLI